MNTLARAVKAIELCTKAEKNWIRLWLTGELNMLTMAELKEEIDGETNE
tara:strand:- start:163 stop:309 length:147 start_codon:yes stop_codon:yes gene_type:complete